ncbi:MAG: hypothetical protein O7G31_09780, partial [Calditrichaeota bacterium]|nr:hypothetical protein [Calditrichota bacterium]
MMQKILNFLVEKGIVGFTIFFAVALAVTVPADSSAQEDPPPSGRHIYRSPPPPGAKTHTVVPGERFRAGGFKKWFYGSDYRHLWTTP